VDKFITDSLLKDSRMMFGSSHPMMPLSELEESRAHPSCGIFMLLYSHTGHCPLNALAGVLPAVYACPHFLPIPWTHCTKISKAIGKMKALLLPEKGEKTSLAISQERGRLWSLWL
jgi:hypothetical protein